MASETVPAAVPGPNDPPHSTAPTAPTTGGEQQQPGGLAGLLAPVEPIRSAAFDLQPDPAATTPDSNTVAGATSSSFSHTENSDTTGKNTKNSGGGKQERSVVRAWLLAGAERWRKGGDARLKALDIKKAKAQARQVKENVTVNRAEKIVGGNTNSTSGNNSNSGKSLNNKASKKDSRGGPKNSSGPSSARGGRGNANGSHKGGSGRGPGGGDSRSKNNSGGSSGGRGTGSGSGGNGVGAGRDRSPGGKDRHTPGKHQPSHADKRSNGGGSAGTGKTGPRNVSGKDQPGQHTPKPSKPNTASGKQDTANGPGKAPHTPSNPTGSTTPNTTDPKTPQTPPKPCPAAPPGTLGKGLWKGVFTTKPSTGPVKNQGTPKNPGPNGIGKGGNTNATPNTGPKPAPSAGTAPARRINLQKSRETGYRDGTRAAKVVAHAHAWRDGARDGYRDTTEAAHRERQRLDKAHADRKNARTRAKDQTVPQPASSAAYQQPTHPPAPQPVTVTGTDTTHIHLGPEATRTSISRGEVRTLRRFQQRLDDKTNRMTQVAEASRTLEHHAMEQAKQVTELLEQARAIEGGDKLVAALTKLQEAAQLQVDKAAEVHKRAVRGHEACKTLHANTDTRYGGIYQAVVDSPETSPAELRYYREMADA